MALNLTCPTRPLSLALISQFALSQLRIDRKGNFIEHPGG
jgi:hypothetical protein